MKNKTNNGMMELFENELRDIYSAETQIVKALPNVIKAAESKDLVDGLTKHLKETKQQVVRLDKIFKLLGLSTKSIEECEAMQGLVKECDEVIKQYDRSYLRDAALITHCQRIEHYEIAVYGALKVFAEQLGMDEAADLLDETLQEEGNADKALTKVAEGGLLTTGINQKI